jgi:hypothetical protein
VHNRMRVYGVLRKTPGGNSGLAITCEARRALRFLNILGPKSTEGIGLEPMMEVDLNRYKNRYEATSPLPRAWVSAHRATLQASHRCD